jgi:GAF domain-containing protein
MASITAMLSTLAAAAVIGWSAQHRPIELLHRSGPGPRVLVVGCIHGNECEGLVVVNALLRTHPHEDLWLLPNLNPDGYDVRHRGNANRTQMEDATLAAGYRSIVVAPLIYQDQLIGSLKLVSPKPGALNVALMPHLLQILPLFAVAVRRSDEVAEQDARGEELRCRAARRGA